VSIAPYVPHYFVPGVDERNYAEGLAFLQRRGFETVSRPLSMDANLVLFDYGPFAAREERLRAEGIDVRALLPHEFLPLLAYLREHASPDWLRDARELLTDITRGLATEAQFTVAVRGDRQIVGYCQFRGEHFGPFGVREDLQGRGIGTVLLAQCLQTMRRQGLHNAWVLWTSDEAAARVYGKLGFRETRRFAVLRREL
jgi:GNAT superfamily N-acetyltransferase